MRVAFVIFKVNIKGGIIVSNPLTIDIRRINFLTKEITIRHKYDIPKQLILLFFSELVELADHAEDIEKELESIVETALNRATVFWPETRDYLKAAARVYYGLDHELKITYKH